MRAMLVLLLGGALLLGCRHSKPDQSDKPAAPVAKTGATRGSKQPATAQVQQAAPVTESAGKVASVNTNLRFVVIDFAFNPVPQLDQRLGVYRNGQKVGEVKISNQARNNIVAADIMAGEAKVGDEVRPE